MSKTKIIISASAVVVVGMVALLIFFLSGEESLEARIMEVFSVDGPDVSVSRGTEVVAASAGARLHDGYGVSTGEESICHIRLDADSLVRMDAQSRISVNRATATSLSILVEEGQVLVDVLNQSPEHELEVLVGNTALGVRGTLFIAGHGDAEAHVIMLEGSVYVDDELPVSAGYVVSLQDDVPLEVAPINVADLDLFAMQAILDYQERVLEAGAITEEELEWIIRMMNVPDYIWIQGVQISTDLTDIAFTHDLYLLPSGFENGFQLDLTNDDLNQLAYMVNLRRLILLNQQVTDITFLTGLIGLRDIEITNRDQDGIIRNAWWSVETHDVAINDIGPLSGLTNLERLILRGHNVDNISPLERHTNLTILILTGNQISDLYPISGLVNLINLVVFSNHVSDITPISELVNLRQLSIGGNRISNISPLSYLTNLESLTLTGNQISNIAPLAGLSNLNHLVMDSIQVNDISPLAELTNLSFVNLSDTPITDWTPVSHVETVWGRP